MNITSAIELHDGGYVIECDEGVFNFIAEPGNRHYVALQEWVAAGGVVEVEAPPPPAVPEVVSRFQARAALHLAGLLPAVETLMADPETDALARLAWTDAQEFRRDSPTIATMAALLGLTAQQLDDLFVSAATITA